MESFKKSSFDEAGWVIGIRRNLEQELEDESDVPVTIFNVPKPLLVGSLHCYVPQQVAIGPYNCFSSEQLEMQRYKIAAAKRMQKRKPNVKFHDVVEQFKKHNLRIRAHYQRFLELNQDTLAWMMAMDTCFLLEFLGVYAAMAGNKDLAPEASSKMSPLIDYSGTKTTHNAIVRDVVMLENQIPLFALRKVLEMQLSSLDSADEVLVSMLVGFCKEISPFRGTGDLQNAHALMMKSAHLLDFLYHTMLPRLEGVLRENEEEIDGEQNEDCSGGKKHSFQKSGDLKKLMGIIWKGMSKFIVFKPLQLVSKLPWANIYNFKDPMEDMLSSSRRNDGAGNVENPPLVEEIGIPSVSKLSNAGVKFAPTYAGIYGINFDAKSRTMHLPMVSVDINSEVVLRNLVAYEACNASGPLVFTRYTELMNGIIDSVEDVMILRQNGIVMNHLKRDGKVTKLWNGMSRSIRLTKVDFLDKTIGDVNKYYEGRWKVKFKKLLTRYVFKSWKILTLLGALLMLMFMALQAFCSVYNCPRMVNRVQNFDLANP